MIDEIRLQLEIVLNICILLVQIQMLMDRVLVSKLVPECSTVSGFLFLAIILSLYNSMYGVPSLLIIVASGITLFYLIMPTVRELYEEWYTCFLFLVWPIYGLSLYGKLRVYG